MCVYLYIVWSWSFLNITPFNTDSSIDWRPLWFYQGTARIFLLTKNSFVLADQKTGQVKASVPLPDLTSVSVSTQSDGFFALKLKEVTTY